MDKEDLKTLTTTPVTDTTKEITMVNINGGTIADQEDTEVFISVSLMHNANSLVENPFMFSNINIKL